MSDNSHLIVPILEGTSIYPTKKELVLKAPGYILNLETGTFKSFSFSETEGEQDLWTGLNNLAVDESAIFFANNILNITNLPDGSIISIASLDGRSVFSGIADNDFQYSFENQPKGVYLIRFNNKSIKIAIK